MKPTLLIDGFNLGLVKGTGVETYARNLSYTARDLGYSVEVLYESPLGSHKNDLLREIAFFDVSKHGRSTIQDFLYQASRIPSTLFGRRATHVPITGNVIADQFRARLPYFDRIWTVPDLFRTSHLLFEAFGMFTNVAVPESPDIMHWTYPVPIRLRRSKNIYTIHDLVPLRLPHTTLDNKRRHHRMIQRILQKADHIVTVSECSKNDICNLFDVPESRISNTYQSVAIPKIFTDRSETEVKNEVEGLFRIDYKEYFLFYGAIEPKKNVGRLIEAYLTSNVRTPLLLVGPLAWLSDNELRLVREQTNNYDEEVDGRRISRKRIMHFDYLPFPLLVSLIRGAKALLFPSLYEGFGLPVLEAMLLKTPVMSSKQGSIPEIAGKAAILVDPYDTREISQAIIELDANPDLRAKLSLEGTKQAALFSAGRYQQRLTEVYSRVNAQRPTI